MDLTPGFELRVVEVEAVGIGSTTPTSGATRWLRSRAARSSWNVSAANAVPWAWDIFWLADLPLRALHNPGDGPALLLAFSRRNPTDEFRGAGRSYLT